MPLNCILLLSGDAGKKSRSILPVPSRLVPNRHFLEMLARRYELLDKIGNGAFGEVHRAKDLQSGEIRAIKRLRVNDDGRLQVVPAAQFQEIEAMRQLQHPNVRPVTESYRHILLTGDALDRQAAGCGARRQLHRTGARVHAQRPAKRTGFN